MHDGGMAERAGTSLLISTIGLTKRYGDVTALDIVERQNDPRWCPLVHGMFSRVKPAGQSPEPNIWMRSLKFLLRHNYATRELLAALPRAGGTVIGEAILLSLEHAPRHALPLIVRRSWLLLWCGPHGG